MFPSQSSEAFNALSATALNPASLQANSAVLAASGLADPLQLNRLALNSSAASASVTADATISTSSPSMLSTTLVTSTIDIVNIIPFFGTPGGSTLDTATNLGSLNGTQSLYDLFGVSSTAPNDFYRIALAENSNFNLSMTGLSADADVRFLNNLGEEIARSTIGGAHDEAINLSGLAAGDYYIQVYQYSGDTGFSLDLSSTAPSNLLPHEINLGTVNYVGTSQTNLISNLNTADVYHFSVDGFYRSGDLFNSYNSSNVTLSLTGLTADADVRIIRDANHNGIIDTGEEIMRSARGGSTSESIYLRGLGVGDYFVQVYQYTGAGATNYTLNLSAQGGSGGSIGHNTFAQADDIHTLNGSRVFSGHVSGRDPQPWTFDYPRDPDDFYRFNLGATSNVNLSLTGLYADADLDLFDSSGTRIDFSHLAGTASDSIQRTLAAGDYYVQVHAYSTNSTDYRLNLNAVIV